jgi:hypothetical protein
MQSMMRPGLERSVPTALVIRCTDYASARDAVDELSDNGFDVSRTAIVWNDVRVVEHVTGRRTTATAAIDGAMSGAWFALLLGVLLAIFVDVDGAGEVFAMLVTYVVLGALFGAAWFALLHARHRGRRDFSAIGAVEGLTYDVVVDPELHADAVRILGVSQGRPMDPTPGGTDRPGAPLPPPSGPAW